MMMMMMRANSFLNLNTCPTGLGLTIGNNRPKAPLLFFLELKLLINELKRKITF